NREFTTMKHLAKTEAAVAILLSSAAAMTASAADPITGPRATGIEEITVTARRREESAQTVPVSLSAFSAERLTEASVQTLSDLTALTPGLRFAAEGGAASTSVSMRGLGKLPIGEGVPGVVLYFAEAPMPSDGVNVPT